MPLQFKTNVPLFQNRCANCKVTILQDETPRAKAMQKQYAKHAPYCSERCTLIAHTSNCYNIKTHELEC